MTKAAKKKEILLPIFSMWLTCLKKTSTSVLFLTCSKRPFAHCKSDEKLLRKNNSLAPCDIIFCSMKLNNMAQLNPGKLKYRKKSNSNSFNFKFTICLNEMNFWVFFSRLLYLFLFLLLLHFSEETFSELSSLSEELSWLSLLPLLSLLSGSESGS